MCARRFDLPQLHVLHIYEETFFNKSDAHHESMESDAAIKRFEKKMAGMLANDGVDGKLVVTPDVGGVSWSLWEG